MMPFRGAIPVAKEQLAQTWQEMLNQTVSPRKRLVYLHIPFVQHTARLWFLSEPF